MGKPNTRKFDQLISEGQRKLAAVQRREMSPLTGSERGAILRAGAVGAAKVARHKSTSRQDQVVDQTWDAAAQRIQAEISAAAAARAQVIAQEAAATVEKKTTKRGWF